MRIWYLSHCQAMNKCPDLSEPWLLIHVLKSMNVDEDSTLRPQAPLEMSAWVFIGGFYAYAISTRISCIDPYDLTPSLRMTNILQSSKGLPLR